MSPADVDNQHLHTEPSLCLAGLRKGRALGSDYTREFVPRADKRLGPFVLKLARQGIHIDAGFGELVQYGFAIAAIG